MNNREKFIDLLMQRPVNKKRLDRAVQIDEAIKAGKKMSELVRELGITKQALYAFCNEFRITLPNERDLATAVSAMAAAGMTAKDIAGITHRSESTIRKVLDGVS